MILNNVAFLFIASAILSIIGNAGIISEGFHKASVMIHYSGLALICIHSFLFLGWKVTLIIIIIDVVVGFISYTVFTKMR